MTSCLPTPPGFWIHLILPNFSQTVYSGPYVISINYPSGYSIPLDPPVSRSPKSLYVYDLITHLHSILYRPAPIFGPASACLCNKLQPPAILAPCFQVLHLPIYWSWSLIKQTKSPVLSISGQGAGSSLWQYECSAVASPDQVVQARSGASGKDSEVEPPKAHRF